MMKTVMILFDTTEESGAEHAKGVLEEELQTYLISTAYIGREMLQSEKIQYIFRDINQPVSQNTYFSIESIYATEKVKKHPKISEYESKGKIQWMKEPSSGIVDFVMEAKEYISTEKILRYTIEGDKVVSQQVEIYKANRSGYYISKEEAVNLILQKEEEEKIRKETLEKQIGFNDKIKKKRKEKKQAVS